MLSVCVCAEYVGHAFHRPDGLVGVVLVDGEYPQRVAQALLNKLLDDFTVRYPRADWTRPDGSFPLPTLKAQLDKFQDPAAADSLTRLQRDLDETKIILHGAMEKLLERGEKLDDLVAKSEDLSMGSKSFYKAARQTNSCCVIL
jgi:synaptobrevin homolog YKT6